MLKIHLVLQIINDVAKNGDKAVHSYTQKFDKVNIDQLEVSREEIKAAGKLVEKGLKKAIEERTAAIKDELPKMLWD